VRLETKQLAPGIEATPGVCGGEPCIAGTRINVRVLECYRRGGWSDETLLANYPSLRQEDLDNAWRYAHAHQSEIDELIRFDESDEEDS
jgi:uncharacterized protein (DUF433 family)